MKLEVFILGGQKIDQKRKKGWWRARGTRKGRRERIEKRSRERIDRERDKMELRLQFEEEEEKHHHLPLLVKLP